MRWSQFQAIARSSRATALCCLLCPIHTDRQTRQDCVVSRGVNWVARPSCKVWTVGGKITLVAWRLVKKFSNEFFTLRNQPHLRGHKYVINKQRCSNNRRNNFFAIESSTNGITCRRVQQTLLAFASLSSHLIMMIFYCWILHIICKPLFRSTILFFI